MSVRRLLAFVAVGLALALGMLTAIGCLLAALFEVQGFGGPRDEGPRFGYLVELAVVFVAAVPIPAVLWRRLLGGGPALVVAGAIAAGGVIVILGASFSGS